VEQMAAAASSLKSQAQDLVQTVAVFKLGAGDTQHSMALPTTAAVRAHPPKVSNFKGEERRAVGTPKGAAARGHTPAPSRPASAKAATPAPLAAPAAKPVTSASGSNDGDWETF
jgi:methyl-accepting chemotaxis protein